MTISELITNLVAVARESKDGLLTFVELSLTDAEGRWVLGSCTHLELGDDEDNEGNPKMKVILEGKENGPPYRIQFNPEESKKWTEMRKKGELQEWEKYNQSVEKRSES